MLYKVYMLQILSFRNTERDYIRNETIRQNLGVKLLGEIAGGGEAVGVVGRTSSWPDESRIIKQLLEVNPRIVTDQDESHKDVTCQSYTEKFGGSNVGRVYRK